MIPVAVLLPVRDHCTVQFTTSLALACSYIAKHQPDVDLRVYTNSGTLIADQRISLARMALDDGAQWTVWFDDDMRFPKDTIERLLSHRLPIVGVNYPTRRWPVIEPTAYVDDETQERLYTLHTSVGLQAVASVGFGCICVHQSVYAALSPPWFFMPWDEEKQKHDCGEDVYFCRKARKAGFDVHIDHDLSKEISHVGVVEHSYIAANALRSKVDGLRSKLVQNHINAIVE